MKAIELVRWALAMTDKVIARLAEDMKDAPLTAPTPNGGNHPLWVMGHLAVSEGQLQSLITGKPNPVKAWEPLFGQKSEPVADASRYPSFAEVNSRFHELRAVTLKLLEDTGDAGLDAAPKEIPEGLEDELKNKGRAFLLVAIHQMMHYGQVSDARRAAGKKPLM